MTRTYAVVRYPPPATVAAAATQSMPAATPRRTPTPTQRTTWRTSRASSAARRRSAAPPAGAGSGTPVQGFGDFNGEDDPQRMVALRVPCGCTAERTELIGR
jgi:hypothetical protein